MTTPKSYSIEGCPFCDKLTLDKEYRGSLTEHRTGEGRTIPWLDSLSGIRLTRTIDFSAETGEVFRGGEITHGQRAHNAVSQSGNLISFTVVSTGMKRYALIQDYGVKGALMRKIRTNQDIPTDEIASDIAEAGNLNDIDDILKTLANNIPPQRIEQVVEKVTRNPKIARLIKERSKYICEICGRRPFMQSNGRLYAEADHIRPLGGSTRGLDTPENMRCLCAQCHAIVTCGSDEVVKELLSSSVKQFS